MFSRLRKAITSLSEAVVERVRTRELREEDLAPVLDEFLINLVESDVAYDVAEKIVVQVREKLVGRRIERRAQVEDVVRESMLEVLREVFPPQPPEPVTVAEEKCRKTRDPFVIVFMGVNGTGKTTSIAKLARRMQKRGLTPVIVAADTFRAGAQEQLETHAKRLGLPIIKAKYGSDPASVAFDAIAFAKKRNYCSVIIDTAGRMHNDPSLVEELRKIIRVTEPDLRILVVDSLTGNDAVEQASSFNEKVGVDGFFLTKTDADAKGGAAISIVASTGKPILYIGTGQSYDDIEPFRIEWLVDKIFSSAARAG